MLIVFAFRYSLSEGADSFTAQAANAQFTLPGDEETGGQLKAQKASSLRWDRKKKRVVQGDGTGADNKKLIKTESGSKLPATFQSGKYEEWRKKKRVAVPRAGESELPNRQGPGGGPGGGRKFRHQGALPKNEKKQLGTKDKTGAAKPLGKQLSSTGRKLKSAGKPGVGQGGLRTPDQIAKERKAKVRPTSYPLQLIAGSALTRNQIRPRESAAPTNPRPQRRRAERDRKHICIPFYCNTPSLNSFHRPMLVKHSPTPVRCLSLALYPAAHQPSDPRPLTAARLLPSLCPANRSAHCTIGEEERSARKILMALIVPLKEQPQIVRKRVLNDGISGVLHELRLKSEVVQGKRRGCRGDFAKSRVEKGSGESFAFTTCRTGTPVQGVSRTCQSHVTSRVLGEGLTLHR